MCACVSGQGHLFPKYIAPLRDTSKLASSCPVVSMAGLELNGAQVIQPVPPELAGANCKRTNSELKDKKNFKKLLEPIPRRASSRIELKRSNKKKNLEKLNYLKTERANLFQLKIAQEMKELVKGQAKVKREERARQLLVLMDERAAMREQSQLLD